MKKKEHVFRGNCPEKAAAMQKAYALRDMMKSSGWKIRVWENMGWCYSIYNGNLQVSPAFEKGKYFAGLSDHEDLLSWHVNVNNTIPIGTPSFWHKTETFKDPNMAVKKQIQRARAFVHHLDLIVSDVEGIK